MAHKPHAREDFLADATALVERVELRLRGAFDPTGAAHPIVAGFRSDGSASLMFGEDPVFQFNSLGQLRRAFVDGMIYKADDGHLVTLTRDRQGGRVQMNAQELPADTAAQFVAALTACLTKLAARIHSGQMQVVATVPADVDVAARLTAWLAAHAERIEIAPAPNAR